MNAWLLAVVSSEAQAETLPHQRAWAEQVAGERGWRVTRIFEGVSTGKDGPRRLVHDLLAEIKALAPAARPSYLLMIRLDRLGRGDVIASQIVLRDLRDLGVKVWTRDGGEERIDSAMQQLISAAKSAVAAHENENRRDKAVAVYKRKRAAGLAIGNKRPYGLTLGSDGKDVVEEPQAEAVRIAYALRLEGLGYHAIARRLLDVAPPQRFKNGKEKNVPWNSYRVRVLLENRAYLGMVVDEVTWERAQRVRETLARSNPESTRRHPWPLTGVLRCYCGTNLIGQCTGRKAKCRYYTCRALRNHNGKYRMNNAQRIEAQFLTLLHRLKADPSLIDQYRRANAVASPALIERNLRAARAALAEVERKRDRVWEMNDKGLVRDEEVQERLDALRVERDELTARTAALENERAIATAMERRDADIAATLAQAAYTYENVGPEDQRRIARVVTLLLGEGLCVEEDRTLTVRRPIDPNAQRRLAAPR